VKNEVCARCGTPLTPVQQRRGNSFCSRTCARLTDWDNTDGRRTRLETDNGVLIKRPDGKWVLEHRYLMELHLGRTLARSERIRWRNGDRTDNRIENLELRASRSTPHCPGCRCFETPKVKYSD
jgi:hypothetical protein